MATMTYPPYTQVLLLSMMVPGLHTAFMVGGKVHERLTSDINFLQKEVGFRLQSEVFQRSELLVPGPI